MATDSVNNYSFYIIDKLTTLCRTDNSDEDIQTSGDGVFYPINKFFYILRTSRLTLLFRTSSLKYS